MEDLEEDLADCSPFRSPSPRLKPTELGGQLKKDGLVAIIIIIIIITPLATSRMDGIEDGRDSASRGWHHPSSSSGIIIIIIIIIISSSSSSSLWLGLCSRLKT